MQLQDVPYCAAHALLLSSQFALLHWDRTYALVHGHGHGPLFHMPHTHARPRSMNQCVADAVLKTLSVLHVARCRAVAGTGAH